MINMGKEMTVDEFIKLLSKSFTDEERKKVKILVGSDEELNTMYKNIEIGFPLDKSKKYAVIYGLSGREVNIDWLLPY